MKNQGVLGFPYHPSGLKAKYSENKHLPFSFGGVIIDLPCSYTLHASGSNGLNPGWTLVMTKAQAANVWSIIPGINIHKDNTFHSFFPMVLMVKFESERESTRQTKSTAGSTFLPCFMTLQDWALFLPLWIKEHIGFNNTYTIPNSLGIIESQRSNFDFWNSVLSPCVLRGNWCFFNTSCLLDPYFWGTPLPICCPLFHCQLPISMEILYFPDTRGIWEATSGNVIFFLKALQDWQSFSESNCYMFWDLLLAPCTDFVGML